jgi:hypothetical protein
MSLASVRYFTARGRPEACQRVSQRACVSSWAQLTAGGYERVCLCALLRVTTVTPTQTQQPQPSWVMVAPGAP